MSERDRYVVAPGPDVDLDVEDIRLRDGTRLTNERADEIAEETLTIARGRPVLGGGTGGGVPQGVIPDSRTGATSGRGGSGGRGSHGIGAGPRGS